MQKIHISFTKNHNPKSWQASLALSLGCFLLALIFSQGQARQQQEALAAQYREQAAAVLSDQSELLAQSNALSEEVAGKKEALASMTAERDVALQRAEDLRHLATELTGNRQLREETLERYQGDIQKALDEISQRRETAGDAIL